MSIHHGILHIILLNNDFCIWNDMPTPRRPPAGASLPARAVGTQVGSRVWMCGRQFSAPPLPDAALVIALLLSDALYGAQGHCSLPDTALSTSAQRIPARGASWPRGSIYLGVLHASLKEWCPLPKKKGDGKRIHQTITFKTPPSMCIVSPEISDEKSLFCAIWCDTKNDIIIFNCIINVDTIDVWLVFSGITLQGHNLWYNLLIS